MSPFAICSLTRILKANAYTTEYNSNYTRIVQPSQFTPEGNWRQNNFAVQLPYHPYPPFYLSFYAVDLYGEKLEKWVSLYDDSNNLIYSSGWSDNIDSVPVRNPWSTSEPYIMHVILRVRYKGGEIPLTPNMMDNCTFIVNFQRRDEVTQPPGWNETTTATYTTATQIIPELTTGTQVTIAATPERLLTHERFLLRVLDNFWNLPDVTWIITACIILVFCAWLLI